MAAKVIENSFFTICGCSSILYFCCPVGRLLVNGIVFACRVVQQKVVLLLDLQGNDAKEKRKVLKAVSTYTGTVLAWLRASSIFFFIRLLKISEQLGQS